MSQRFLDGLDASSWRTDADGAGAGFCVLGIAEIGVNRMLSVDIQFDEVAVNLVGAVFLGPFARVGEGSGLEACHLFLPELPEVGRLLGVGFDLFGREAHLHVVLALLAVDGGHETEVSESRGLAGADVQCGASVLQFQCARLVGCLQVVRQRPGYLRVHRHAIQVELDVYRGLFARLVEPVTMVGNRHPEIVGAVGIVLGMARAGRQR